MSIPKPHFELARVYDDGSRETEIVSVVALPLETKMDRRGFLGAGATAGAVLGALSTACTPARVAEGQRQPRIPRTEAAPAAIGDCGGLRAHANGVLVLAMSPDGTFLASWGYDSTIKLWGLPDGVLRRALVGHRGSVKPLAFSPDGTLLASGSDNTIKLSSLPEGALRNTLKGHNGWVLALAASPDGKLLASGSADKTIKLWSLPDGALRKTLEGHTGPIHALAISPDGTLLASSSSDNTIKLWDLQQGALRKTLEGHKRYPVYALALSSDGKLLASGSLDNSIKLWSLPEGALHKTLEGHTGGVNALAIRPDGTLLVSGSHDNTIKLWNLPEGTLRKSSKGHKSSVAALAITPDGKLLASGSNDSTIMLWGLPNGESKTCMVDLKATRSTVQGVTYQYRNEYGQVVTYTLPCGSPIPPGAVCTCNCVPGTHQTPAPAPAAPSTGGGYRYCTCVPVCTCIPVCQAHRVLHENPVVRTMAEELLLLMGAREFEYMAWAADKAEPALRVRIREIMRAIDAGALPDPERWPSADECIARLDDPDDVIALMAAQLLAQKTIRQGLRLDEDRSRRANQLICEANARSPFRRTCHQCTRA